MRPRNRATQTTQTHGNKSFTSQHWIVIGHAEQEQYFLMSLLISTVRIDNCKCSHILNTHTLRKCTLSVNWSSIQNRIANLLPWSWYPPGDVPFKEVLRGTVTFRRHTHCPFWNYLCHLIFKPSISIKAKKSPQVFLLRTIMIIIMLPEMWRFCLNFFHRKDT